ncbi:MAG TPA: ABC transporter ATP-binding protein [Chloroflexota bacterium]|nr:ABC transporter ATP-binding protein [Chloroflexota bacterium]
MKLAIDRLSKRFGTHWALKDFSLSCEMGLLGLVGPNGAGKTTAMRIIATLLPPTTGSVLWGGQSVLDGRALRRVLGYLPQEFGVYPDFTARQFLAYLAAMKEIPDKLARRRVEEVLELVNLERAATQRLGTFSGGMKQRIGIAQALLNDPELLIVDEPTAGLDPAERVHFRTMLAGLTMNRIVILSTHIIGDVEAVAGRLIVLRDGQMLADSTPEALIETAAGQVWTVTTDAASTAELQRRCTVSALVARPGGASLRILSANRPHPNATTDTPTLEDAYLLLLGAMPGAAGSGESSGLA